MYTVRGLVSYFCDRNVFSFFFWEWLSRLHVQTHWVWFKIFTCTGTFDLIFLWTITLSYIGFFFGINNAWNPLPDTSDSTETFSEKLEYVRRRKYYVSFHPTFSYRFLSTGCVFVSSSSVNSRRSVLLLTMCEEMWTDFRDDEGTVRSWRQLCLLCNVNLNLYWIEILIRTSMYVIYVQY